MNAPICFFLFFTLFFTFILLLFCPAFVVLALGLGARWERDAADGDVVVLEQENRWALLAGEAIGAVERIEELLDEDGSACVVYSHEPGQPPWKCHDAWQTSWQTNTTSNTTCWRDGKSSRGPVSLTGCERKAPVCEWLRGLSVDSQRCDERRWGLPVPGGTLFPNEPALLSHFTRALLKHVHNPGQRTARLHSANKAAYFGVDCCCAGGHLGDEDDGNDEDVKRSGRDWQLTLKMAGGGAHGAGGGYPMMLADIKSEVLLIASPLSCVGF